MSEREEHRNMLALQKGSLTAFRALYDLYFSTVYNYCFSFIRVREDAEEISSEVFITLWRRRAALDVRHGSAKPLLFKISRDLVWNHLRKIASRRQDLQDYLKVFPIRPSVRGEDPIILEEQKQKLRHALNELTPQQEKVFKLRFFQGRDLNQIAEQLKISKNTVKVHLAKSKQFIMSALTQLILLLHFMLI